MKIAAGKTVFVIAAHPDDEMLGCGGTMARFRSMGGSVTILLLGEGPTARREDNTQDSRDGSKNSAIAAAKILGVDNVHFSSFPDNRFDTVPLLELVRVIEKEAEQIQPDFVFTHFAGDLNRDHQLTHRAVMTAFRPLPGRKIPVIASFEVLSSTEYASVEMGYSFHPTLYIDIASFLDAKQKALSQYASEMRPWPHPRSHEAVEHLARLRGSQCGCEAAEAFVLCRGVF